MSCPWQYASYSTPQRDTLMMGDMVRVHRRRGGQVNSREFWIGQVISVVLTFIFSVHEPHFSTSHPPASPSERAQTCPNQHHRSNVKGWTSRAQRSVKRVWVSRGPTRWTMSSYQVPSSRPSPRPRQHLSRPALDCHLRPVGLSPCPRAQVCASVARFHEPRADASTSARAGFLADDGLVE